MGFLSFCMPVFLSSLRSIYDVSVALYVCLSFLVWLNQADTFIHSLQSGFILSQTGILLRRLEILSSLTLYACSEWFAGEVMKIGISPSLSLCLCLSVCLSMSPCVCLSLSLSL